MKADELAASRRAVIERLIRPELDQKMVGSACRKSNSGHIGGAARENWRQRICPGPFTGENGTSFSKEEMRGGRHCNIHVSTQQVGNTVGGTRRNTTGQKRIPWIEPISRSL